MRLVMMALLLSATGWARAQNNITGMEYWVDQNGDGRTAVDIADAGYASLNTSIDVNALPYGQHTLHYRLRDTQGQWSAVLTKHFTRKVEGPDAIVAGEYWFDQDATTPQPLALVAGNTVNWQQDIDVSGLSRGQHRVHYRMRDERGNWSSVLSKAFTVKESGPYHLVQYRYWTDEAEQPADMHYVPFDPQEQFVDLSTGVAFCSNTLTGTHAVYFQLQDNHGHWSSVVKPVVNVNIGETNGTLATPTGLSGPASFEPGMSYTLTVNPTVPGATGYTWNLPAGWTGDSNTGTIVVQTPSDIAAGPLYIGITAFNDCGQSSTYQYYILSEGVMATESHGLALYPNPTLGHATLTSDGQVPITRMLVLNTAGQTVREVKPTASDRLALDLNNEADGLYTVLVTQGSTQTRLQLMVQH